MTETESIEEKNPLLFVEYRRVSTLKQRDKCTIKRQELLNSKFMEYNKSRYKVGKLFVDDGRSGFKAGKEERPDYHNMIEFLENNEQYNGVFTLKIDRLGRDTQELINFKEYIKKMKKVLLLGESGLLIKFETPMDDLIFDIQAGISSYVGKSIINKMQFMRRVEYDEHPEKFGRPKKEIPENLKEKIIHWYKKQKLGFKLISNLILAEDIKKYPDWFQRKYIGFGKTLEEEKQNGKKRFYLSPVTIGKRLKEWEIEIRKSKGSE
ncbi:MAG: recombinase family protein [Candidatus Odinarchaeota archaeon]